MKESVVSLLSKKVKLKKEDIEKLIEVPKNPRLGDYAFPCFALAKELKKNPAEIAKDFALKIKSKEFEKVESSGPYVNFFLNRTKLAEKTLNKIKKEKDNYGSLNIEEKVVIEFPSPNTNKPLHIGHARNIILGQAVSNIMSFNGNKVWIVNLNNDRGVHICKSMLAYEKFGKNDSPGKTGRKSDHFVGDYYVKFAKAAKENPDLEREAQLFLQKWEAGDKKIIALWKKMNSWALSGFDETYKKFGLEIDKNYYESKIYNSGKEIIMKALSKGIVDKKEDGAIYADLSKEGLGEKILLRADGTSIYITQDIYLALLKYQEYKFDKSIVISATEQNHHFKVLFSILKKLGYPWADKLQHLSYGMVNLESGRMKSREGNVVDSDDLIKEMNEMALEEVNKRYPELSSMEKKRRADAISMAAIRYYFLKVDKVKDLTFRPEESLKFEGDTGPYLLYSFARAKSILAKAKRKKKKESGEIGETEKQLVSLLANFPQIVEEAYKNYAPSVIAGYSFQLAQAFNEFYHKNQVLGSKNESFRLSLVAAFSQVVKNALKLLGIETIEKM